MSDFLEPIKNWFGYDRRERRVSFLLLILILIVIGIRMSYPHNKTEVIDLTSDFTFDNEKVSENKMISRISELSDTSVKAVRIGAGRNHFNSKNSEIIELNSCDSAILEGLPGIGPVLSARIIRFRNLLGGFSSVNQLKEVYGLSPETFESIKGRFSADQSKTRKTNINSADYNELSHIPYLRKPHIISILKYREISDSIISIEELVKNKIIPDSIARRIEDYIMF